MPPMTINTPTMTLILFSRGYSSGDVVAVILIQVKKGAVSTTSQKGALRRPVITAQRRHQRDSGKNSRKSLKGLMSVQL